MAKWKCAVCGYVHDSQKDGDFENLPADWVCPICKAEKGVFAKEGEGEKKEIDTSVLAGVDENFSALENSIVCSNLAKGCEKQYLAREAELFQILASHFKGRVNNDVTESLADLLEMVDVDLDENYPILEAVCKENGDRGALRAHTWSVKVSTMVKSLLKKYGEVGEAMLEDAGVYVCTICGFVHVGKELPDVCPVCKVPNYKFEEIGGDDNE
ncbi:MAG: rubredoxin [Bacillota bacterium]